MKIEPYGLSSYGQMIADRIRMSAYFEALRATIRPGVVVMDLGCGPGIMAVQACLLGAKHVYAIEPGEIIQLAREVATANRVADKIEFIEDVSTNVSIPGRTDVIVSDLRGVLPFYDHHIATIVDARRRFLAPGGTLIGRADRIWAAVFQAPERYSEIVGPWERELPGQDLSPGRRRAVNEIHKMQSARALPLTPPELWVTLDYTRVECPDAEGELTFTAHRDGTGHGLAIWFDAELADGVGFSNCPGQPGGIYGSLFLPWERPVPLAPGQTVRVHLQAKAMEEDYFWRWASRIDPVGHTGEGAVEFDQSVLQGATLSPAKLLKKSSEHVPQLSEEGLMRRRALELMDRESTLGEISKRLAAEFPNRFPRWEQALTFAGAVAEENCR
jgi:type I protein arginine methyltransferase